ncbi:DoxX family membrane protein [soil metagenome]
MTLIRSLARPMLSSMFVAGGIDEIRNAAALAPAAKPVTQRVAPLVESRIPSAVPLPSDTAGWVRADGALKVAAGLALATGRFPRVASLVLIGSLVPTTLTGHAFWKENDDQAKVLQRQQFFKNVSMAGGLLIAAVDVEPSARERMEIAARRVKRRVQRDS